MNDAFAGDYDTTYVPVQQGKNFRVKKVTKSRRGASEVRVSKTAKPRELEPVTEFANEDNDMALVPVTYQQQRKARNALLKHRAKMTVGNATFKGSDDTFVTGGGVPGRHKTAKLEDSESEEEKEYEMLEDKLLD